MLVAGYCLLVVVFSAALGPTNEVYQDGLFMNLLDTKDMDVLVSGTADDPLSDPVYKAADENSSSDTLIGNVEPNTVFSRKVRRRRSVRKMIKKGLKMSAAFVRGLRVQRMLLTDAKFIGYDSKLCKMYIKSGGVDRAIKDIEKADLTASQQKGKKGVYSDTGIAGNLRIEMKVIKGSVNITAKSINGGKCLKIEYVQR